MEDPSVAPGDEGASQGSPPSSAQKPGGQSNRKVVIQLAAVGSAPLLKKQFQKLKMDGSFTVGYLANQLRKTLNVAESEPLFLFINQAFSPTPDVELGQLFDSFSCDGKLFVHYCHTVAWG